MSEKSAYKEVGLSGHIAVGIQPRRRVNADYDGLGTDSLRLKRKRAKRVAPFDSLRHSHGRYSPTSRRIFDREG